MDNHHLRAIILKLENRLSNDDRRRLHFYLGNDVPRRIRDDPSLGGTLSLIESLFDQDIINEKDFTYLIKAFEDIQCIDAVKLLKEYRQGNESMESLSMIMPSMLNHLMEDQEDDDQYSVKQAFLNQQSISGTGNIMINSNNTHINPTSVVIGDQQTSDLKFKGIGKGKFNIIKKFSICLLLFVLLSILGYGLGIYFCVKSINQMNGKIQELKEQIKENQDITFSFLGSKPKQTAKVSTFFNVIVSNGSDPWMYKHTDGWYYMTRTTDIDIRIWRSRSFTSIDAGDSITVWKPQGNTSACTDIWAPELHFFEAHWYIYFSATTCDRNIRNHRMFVLENTNSDPFTGSFIWRGQITDSTNKWAIHGTPFKHPSGQFYFIWSGWKVDIEAKRVLYIARMSDPLTISSQRIKIETNHIQYMNEAPQITIRNNSILLVYSATSSWTNDYYLGLITASIDSDLMNADSWNKHLQPIFRSSGNNWGPGHHSFTKSPDNQEDWIIYDIARYQDAGRIRHIRAQKFTWHTNSTPNLGEPANRNVPIQIPSGDQSRDRYEAEAAVVLQNVQVLTDETASNRSKVGYIDYSDSTIVFNIECTKSGTYVIVIRNSNGSGEKALATHRLSISNGHQIEVPVVNSGWGKWDVSLIRTHLTQGANTITVKKGINTAEIDVIDVFLDI